MPGFPLGMAAISVAASICLHAFEERNAVGLIANASVPQSDQPVKVAPGRSPEQMRYILVKLREMLLGHPMVSPDPARVRFVGFGAYLVWKATQERQA